MLASFKASKGCGWQSRAESQTAKPQRQGNLKLALTRQLEPKEYSLKSSMLHNKPPKNQDSVVWRVMLTFWRMTRQGPRFRSLQGYK